MAQVTRVTFASNLAALITDNTNGDISAADIRSILTDLEDSAVWFDEVGTAAASNTGDFAAASHTHAAADVSSGTFADARIAQTSITQHEAAITVTVSQIGDINTGDNLLMTAAERSKLTGVEAGATADQTAGEIQTAYDSQVSVVSQAEAEAGTATTARRWTAQRVSQAIAALAPGGGASSLADLTDVDATVGSPSDGDILVYRSAGSDWILETKPAGGSNPAWGDITGTLSSQTDLQSALDGKADSSHTHAAADVTSGTFADGRIAQSNVTQHQAALSITESQVSDLGAYLTDITGQSFGSLSDVTITSIANGEVLQWDGSAWINRLLSELNIAASDITSGTFADARISQSSVTQHQASLTITESQISDLGAYFSPSGDIIADANNTRDVGSDAVRMAEGHFQRLFVAGQELTTSPEQETIGVEVFAPTTDVVTGDGAAYVAIPSELNTWNLVAVGATHVTAGAGGTATSIQVHNVTDAVDMLSTTLTVDSTELNSSTATAAVIDTANDDVATLDLIRIDIDGADTSTAPQGLIVLLTFEET